MKASFFALLLLCAVSHQGVAQMAIAAATNPSDHEPAPHLQMVPRVDANVQIERRTKEMFDALQRCNEHKYAWDVTKAAMEARDDAGRGSLKVYISGTYSAGPVGIPVEYLELVRDLPKVPAGVGCLFGPGDVWLRNRQRDYATIYNREVLRILRSSAGQKAESPGGSPHDRA